MLDLGVESPTFRIAEIDLNFLDEVRHSMPIVKSFRDDLYLQLPLTKSKFFNVAILTIKSLFIWAKNFNF